MNTRSVYFRLTVWYSGLVIAVSVAFGAYTYRSVQEGLYQEIEQLFSNRIEHITHNILAQAQGAEDVSQQINALYSPGSNSRLIRISKDGQIFFVSGTPKDGSFNPSEIKLSPAQDNRWIERLPSHHDMLMVSRPVTVKGETYLIEVGMPVGELNSTLKGLFAALLLGLPFVVLVASVGGYLLVRRALVPVDDIRSTAMKITFGNLSQRLPVAATGDSIEQLSLSLNQMLERLETAYTQLSRFSMDASHELRTPLTIMKAELESLLTEKSVRKEAELEERISSMLEEAERLSHIVESLFSISMLDGGEARTVTERIDITELVRSTAEQMLLLAEDKSIDVEMKLRSPLWINGDSARLKQVIVNILDNAIKYTPEQGKIIVETDKTDTLAVVKVTDTGIGIPAEALPHVFERFYRADKMRSRAMGGAGLGLSIVRSICLAHGGNAKIVSTEGSGTTCSIELPLSS